MINDKDVNLVAHFYIDTKREIFPFIYRVHFACLRHYKDIFKNVDFTLAIDDIDNQEYLNFYRKMIIDMGFNGNISINVAKNDVYREAKTFYNKIATKLDSLEGITYFIHGKGLTNIGNSKYKDDAVTEWVISMYYQLFGNMDYVYYNMFDTNVAISYGAFMFNNIDCFNRYLWYYAGSFQCINTKKLYNYIKSRNIHIPTLCDRAYAEVFLGDLMPFDPYVCKSCGEKYGISFPKEMYLEAGTITREHICVDVLDDYLEFYNLIKKEISEYEK